MKKTIDAHGRTCNACGDYKKWPEYPKDKHSKTGHKACCSLCERMKIPSKLPKRVKREPVLEGFCPRKQQFYLMVRL